MTPLLFIIGGLALLLANAFIIWRNYSAALKKGDKAAVDKEFRGRFIMLGLTAVLLCGVGLYLNQPDEISGAMVFPDQAPQTQEGAQTVQPTPPSEEKSQLPYYID